jgi:hypothetical protein
MVVHDQVTSVEPEELSDNRMVHHLISELPSELPTTCETLFNITDTRLDNFAGKCQGKHSSRPLGLSTSIVVPEWVSPLLVPLTAEDIHRIVSISDPSKSSAGSRLFHATQEKDSEMLATLPCETVILLNWEDPLLRWVMGRNEGKPVLDGAIG